MNIIFVCTGNTCRSPFAEGYFNSLKLYGFKAYSRGLSFGGDLVSRYSAEVAKEYGFNIDGHTSLPFSKEDFKADYIFTMTENIRNILLQNGGNEKNIFVLGNGIPDPFGGDIEVYRNCLGVIAEEIDSLVFGGFFGSISVTNMEDKDIPEIARLEKAYFSEPWSENAIKESSQNNTSFFVAKSKENLVGYIGLNHILDEGYVTSISVEENSRNKNAGALLIDRCVSFGRKIGLSFISLEVRKSNENAVKLYEKSGFKKEGIRKNFYSFPKEDAIIMTRRLNNKC